VAEDRRGYFTWEPGDLVPVEPVITEVGQNWTGTAAEFVERHGGAAAWTEEATRRLYALAVGESATMVIASETELVIKRVG